MDNQIQDLGMLDTDYAAYLAKECDPDLDRKIIALFKDKPRYRHLARFLELITKDRPPTDAEWEEIYSVWDKRYKERGEKTPELDEKQLCRDGCKPRRAEITILSLPDTQSIKSWISDRLQF